ncbi:MAG: dynamin family protein [Oscillospiraceae bacterium]|nr:dynamin family protein [Oscillospiraceae bacterium]
MNKHLAKYEDKKAETGFILNEIQKFYTENGYSSEAGMISDFISLLSKDEFSIVIVGEFSVGKSTFLNALMGEKILPSYSDETTATVTFLRHKDKSGQNEKGKVFYADGSSECIDSIDTNTISRYVSTRSDIPVAATVNHLDLYLDSPFLQHNVTLVDTPGLNGTADGHREITEAQILKSNVCIFMFSADRPGGKSEFEFLSQIKTRASKVIFVLNKIDQIRKNENESYESVAQNMLKNFGKAFPNVNTVPEFWCVSSYQALVARSKQELSYRGRSSFNDDERYRLLKMSRMEEFEDGLWQFITDGEKAKNVLITPIIRAKKMVEETLKNIELESSIYKYAVNDDETRQIIESLEGKIKETDEKMKRLKSRIFADVEKAKKGVIEFAATKIRLFKGRQLANLESYQTTEELIDLEKSLPSIINNGASAATFEVKEKLVTDMSAAVGRFLPDIAESVQMLVRRYPLNICPDCTYKQTANTFVLGIEQYQKSVAVIIDEINTLQSDVDVLSLLYVKALKAEKERAKLRAEIELLREEKVQYENGLEKPKVKRTYSTEEKERFSFFNLFRKKKNLVSVREEIDDSETRAWKREVDEKLRSYDERIRERTMQLNSVAYNGKSSTELNEDIHMKTSIISELHKQVDEKRAVFKDRYVRENIALFLKKKMYIESFYTEGINSYVSIATNQIEAFTLQFMGQLNALLDSDLHRRFELINKNIRALRSQLALSESEKSDKIRNIQRQVGTLKTLCLRIDELYMELVKDDSSAKMAI